MRIIAGQWRGRRLTAPDGQATRPTADRTRETLFSMLTSRLGGFTGLAVADLFAGSGALGLEALSRGAASCIFVDTDRAAIATIRANAAALGANGADIRQASAFALPPLSRPLDLVVMDPPYGVSGLTTMLDGLAAKGWAGPETLIALETARGETIAPPTLDIVADRQVGKAQLTFLRLAAP